MQHSWHHQKFLYSYLMDFHKIEIINLRDQKTIINCVLVIAHNFMDIDKSSLLAIALTTITIRFEFYLIHYKKLIQQASIDATCIQHISQIILQVVISARNVILVQKERNLLVSHVVPPTQDAIHWTLMILAIQIMSYATL